MTGAATAVGMPPVGSVAPDFTLPSTSGSDVTLSQLRGKNVLLAFFPLAFTRVCTTELCSFTEDYGAFRDANTEVLPISVDSIPTLQEFKSISERAYLVAKLRENGWNISKTAEVIDTPRSNLYKKLEQYQISEATDGR